MHLPPRIQYHIFLICTLLYSTNCSFIFYTLQPVIVSAIIGMAALVIPILLHWFLHFPILLTLLGVAFILLIIAGGVYIKTCKLNF